MIHIHLDRETNLVFKLLIEREREAQCSCDDICTVHAIESRGSRLVSFVV